MRGIFPETKRSWSDGLPSFNQDYRNPYEIYFGLFGGEDDSGGGSDNVDRSNPNEMAAREAAAARAGTVTDGQGNAVTSGGGTGVVTSGTQGQQVAAREAFNAATGNQRSNFAQDQYDQVRAREDAALQRAAAAGRLAGSDTGVDASAVNLALGRGDPNEIFDFDITQNPNVTTDDLSSSTPSMALPGSLPASRSAEVSRALSRTSSAILSMPNAGIGSGIPRNLIDDELKTRAEAGDRIAQAGLTPSPYELATDSRVPAVGIMTTPAATAANVLGIDRSNPREMAARESNMARMATADAGMITDATPRSNQVVLGGGVDDMGSGVPLGGSYDRFTRGSDNMNLVNDARFGGPATLPTAAGTVRDLQRARNDASMLEDLRTTAPASIAAGPVLSGATTVDDDFAEMGQRGGLTQAQINAGIGYDARGLPRGLQTFTNNQGITATTNLAGTTQAQRDNMPFYMNPEEGGLVDTIFGNPLDTAYGYELNRQGDVTGVVGRPMGGGMIGAGAELLTNAIMGPPETVEDLLNRSVYTGFGEGSQIGMDDGGGDSPTKAANDPCPAGYQMVDGACQISGDEATDPAAPGSGFVINPTTGLPTLFSPKTQATQVGQINPFVLQPYTPQQQQDIQRGRRGVVALSPTGAALGRAI